MRQAAQCHGGNCSCLQLLCLGRFCQQSLDLLLNGVIVCERYLTRSADQKLAREIPVKKVQRYSLERDKHTMYQVQVEARRTQDIK